MKKDFTKIKLEGEVLRKIHRLTEKEDLNEEEIIDKLQNYINQIYESYNNQITWEIFELNLTLMKLQLLIPKRKEDIKQLKRNIEEERSLSKEYEEDYINIKNISKKFDFLLDYTSDKGEQRFE